jgi:hypothetical protein
VALCSRWPIHPDGCRNQESLGELDMLDLPYSLVIEATNEPDYFGAAR